MQAVRWAVVAVLLVAGCGDDEPSEAPPGDEPAKTLCDAMPSLCGGDTVAEPAFGDVVQVVPSAAMPADVESLDAHNNLDVEWHADRLWFAFRTGPSHFASEDVVMYIVSSADLVSWRFEGKFALGTDVREPQFLSLDGKLLFYLAVLGTNPLAFEPQGSKITEYRGPGDWTPLEDVFDDSFIPWRIRVIDGQAEVLGYTGGENVYELDDPQPIEIQWLVSSDGRTWTPKIPGQPVVLTGGGSETDLATLDDGTIVAVVRNEAGDEMGFGSKVCRAEADAPGDWKCAHDPRKYDSPLVFREGDAVYLIARRHVTDTGHYDLGQTDKPMSERYLAYQGAYWEAPKRCALWKVDHEALEVTHILDLPSKGDTCFPEALPLEPGRRLVFNYTSPYDGDDDPTWLDGQWAPTLIYRGVLSLP